MVAECFAAAMIWEWARTGSEASLVPHERRGSRKVVLAPMVNRLFAGGLVMSRWKERTIWTELPRKEVEGHPNCCYHP